MKELEKLLEIAVKNYTQLGGIVHVQDNQKQQENNNIGW